jgi:hypothetical protein
MAQKQNLNLADEYGNKLTLWRPRKKGRDETLHMEVEVADYKGEPIVTCFNFDFISANELAEALIRYARKLKFLFPEEPEPTMADPAIHTGTDCWCIADKVEPAPYSWQEPWGKDWFNVPTTVTSPTNFKYTVWNTNTNKG